MELSKRMKDLTGQTFGSLTAVRPIRLSTQGTVIWEFKCTCGNLTEWIGNNVVCLAKKANNPAVPSCGCVRDARAIEHNTTHGYTKHPLHSVWQSMKQRCFNPNHPEYSRYGAKGVTVCDEWKHDVAAFITWAIEHGWEKGKHLDKDIRSDNAGMPRVYGPTTCQFLTSKENVGYSGNRRNFANNSRIKLTPTDVAEIKTLYQTGTLNQYELARQFGVAQTSIWRAIHQH